MCDRSLTLRALVNERLTAAAEEIFALVERTIAEYEEELCRSKEENQRKQQLLDSVLVPQEQRGFRVSGCRPPPGGPSRDLHPQVEPHSPAHFDVRRGDRGVQPRTVTSGAADPESCETLQIKQEVDEPSIKQESPPPQTAEDEEQTDNDEDWVRPALLVARRTDDGDKTPSEKRGAAEGAGPASKRTPKSFSCSVCHKVFAQKATLRIHASTHFDAQTLAVNERLTEKTWRCGFCGKAFTHLDDYSAHVALRHTRPFSCSECGARFCRRRSAVGHMSVHTGLLPFRCGECDAQFVQKKKLKEHGKSHSKSQKSGRD